MTCCSEEHRLGLGRGGVFVCLFFQHPMGPCFSELFKTLTRCRSLLHGAPLSLDTSVGHRRSGLGDYVAQPSAVSWDLPLGHTPQGRDGAIFAQFPVSSVHLVKQKRKKFLIKVDSAPSRPEPFPLHQPFTFNTTVFPPQRKSTRRKARTNQGPFNLAGYKQQKQHPSARQTDSPPCCRPTRLSLSHLQNRAGCSPCSIYAVNGERAKQSKSHTPPLTPVPVFLCLFVFKAPEFPRHPREQHSHAHHPCSSLKPNHTSCPQGEAQSQRIPIHPRKTKRTWSRPPLVSFKISIIHRPCPPPDLPVTTLVLPAQHHQHHPPPTLTSRPPATDTAWIQYNFPSPRSRCFAACDAPDQ